MALSQARHITNLILCAASTSSHLGGLKAPAIIYEGFCIGQVNDLTFFSYSHQIPPQLCGLFNYEHQFLVVFAFLDYPPNQADNKLDQ